MSDEVIYKIYSPLRKEVRGRLGKKFTTKAPLIKGVEGILGKKFKAKSPLDKGGWGDLNNKKAPLIKEIKNYSKSPLDKGGWGIKQIQIATSPFGRSR